MLKIFILVSSNPISQRNIDNRTQFGVHWNPKISDNIYKYCFDSSVNIVTGAGVDQLHRRLDGLGFAACFRAGKRPIHYFKLFLNRRKWIVCIINITPLSIHAINLFKNYWSKLKIIIHVNITIAPPVDKNQLHRFSFCSVFSNYRSQWPRALTALTLGSWVRIPLEAWMLVCLFCVCVVLCR
jgi:hypothetical protein